jgi:hypothetical protein
MTADVADRAIGYGIVSGLWAASVDGETFQF